MLSEARVLAMQRTPSKWNVWPFGLQIDLRHVQS
jgi:hypothetical protein